MATIQEQITETKMRLAGFLTAASLAVRDGFPMVAISHMKDAERHAKHIDELIKKRDIKGWDWAIEQQSPVAFEHYGSTLIMIKADNGPIIIGPVHGRQSVSGTWARDFFFKNGGEKNLSNFRICKLVAVEP